MVASAVGFAFFVRGEPDDDNDDGDDDGDDDGGGRMGAFSWWRRLRCSGGRGLDWPDILDGQSGWLTRSEEGRIFT